MKNKKLFTIFLVLVASAILLTACATPNPMKDTPLEQTNMVYGFWYGLWDGMTAVFAFIGNLFGGHYGVYQVHNNGNWYDFGFLIGVGAFAGGSSSAASSRRR